MAPTTMQLESKIRERVYGGNAFCKFEVCWKRKDVVTRAILDIAALEDLESKIRKTSEAYDEINSGQDKAIRLFENCCIYGFFTKDKDFELQAMYLTSKGHFQSIMTQLEKEGPYQVKKSTIMTWVRAVALDLQGVQHMTKTEMTSSILREFPSNLDDFLAMARNFSA